MKTLGEGTFGKVKLGTHILTGERVAVKVLEKERIEQIADVERVAREIHILKLIRKSRHIIQLYEIIETPRQLYLIMEYAPGGELFDYIVEHGRAEEPDACRFLHQILAGVERVHEMNVVHRDLKPENLLLTENKDIKIVDFGLSNTHREDQLLHTACGSPCYAAPEMIENKPYVPCMVDIWSCGVILFALVCGYLPFEDENHVELYRKICSAEYAMPDFVSPEVADLIRGMLTTDPAKRLTLAQIRKHVWYTQMPEQSLRESEDKGQLEEPILEQLNAFGFSRDQAAKCLLSNKHNHLTTTYYLLKERRLRDGDRDHCAKAVAEIEATCAEDALFGSAPLAAAQATPSRGTQAKGSASADVNGHRRHHGDPFDSAATPVGELDDVGQASSSRSPRQPRPHSASRVQGRRHADEEGGGRPQTARGHRSHHEQYYATPSSARGAARPYSARGSGGDQRRWVPVDRDRSEPATREASATPAGPSGSGRRGRRGGGGGRGGHNHDGQQEAGGRDSMQVTCGSEAHPRRIVQEVLQALNARHLSCRKVSNYTVRCQDGDLRIQFDVLQVDRGGRYMLRMSRVSGDAWQFKDLCARLISEMVL